MRKLLFFLLIAFFAACTSSKHEVPTRYEEFISYLTPTEENMEQILSSETDADKREQLKGLNEDSNPILVLYSYE